MEFPKLEIEIKGITGSGKTLVGHIIAEHLRTLGWIVDAPDAMLDDRTLPQGWKKKLMPGQEVQIVETNIPRVI
jgi:hypothetical protein